MKGPHSSLAGFVWTEPVFVSVIPSLAGILLKPQGRGFLGFPTPGGTFALSQSLSCSERSKEKQLSVGIEPAGATGRALQPRSFLTSNWTCACEKGRRPGYSRVRKVAVKSLNLCVNSLFRGENGSH